MSDSTILAEDPNGTWVEYPDRIVYYGQHIFWKVGHVPDYFRNDGCEEDYPDPIKGNRGEESEEDETAFSTIRERN